MRSGTPKVLHPLCGRPMVLHVVDALAELPLERIVIVVGHGAERVTKTLQEQLVTEVPVEFVEQRVQRGTGDAVSVALTSSAFDDLDAEDDILVLPGDHPLLQAETIAMLATEHRVQDAAATILTAHVRRSHRLRPRHPRQGRSRRPHRRARRRRRRRARGRRDQHVDLLLPAQPARAGAAPPEPRERAGRVLPHRRDRGAARRGPQGDRGRRPTIRPRRSASTTACSSPTPRPCCGGRINRRWMRDGVTMVDPVAHLHRRDRRARARRAPAAGHDPRGPHVDRGRRGRRT